MTTVASSASGASATDSTATSPVSPHSSTASSSPTSPSDAASAAAATAAAAARKLSAAAREFQPTGGLLQYPAVPGAAPPVEANTRDEFLAPDDAEDDEELDAFIASVVGTEAQPIASPDPALLQQALLRQTEYLLSNQQLWMNADMQDEMKNDETNAGYVSLKYLCSLKAIKRLKEPTPADLAKALKPSEKLTLNADSTHVKRQVPLQPYDAYKDSNRTVFIDRLPPGSTVDSVKKLFSRFGRVTYVLRADRILGATGMNAEEKGKLTPHTSPKLRPRSMSSADIGAGRLSPSLMARKLSGAGLTPGQSPSLTGLSQPLSHLSPAQRNRVIAATTPVDNPECFTAAFIQFEKPACCKKAVSHIVAYNKQLKAQTPKGSPRIPGARRGSHGGIPSLPAAALGGSGHSVMSLPGDAALPQSSPPRSRSIKISSSPGALSPKVSAVLSPVRMTVRLGEGILTSPSDQLPPAHPVSTVSPPPRHALSPPPNASAASPSSPAHLGLSSASKKPRAESVSGPPSQGTPKMGGLDSPAFVPAGSTGELPDLSLGATATSTPTNASATTPASAPLVAPLPDSFIGMFVMPKISYLKSLKTRPGEQQQQKKGASALNSPALQPQTVPAQQEKEKKNGGEDSKQQQSQHSLNREKAVSPLAPLALGQAATASSSSSAASAPEKVVKLSAAAPVFQPSTTPLLIPLIAPKALLSSMSAASASPPMRAQKGNWRSDGSTPVIGSAQATQQMMEADFGSFALGAAATGSPSLGPQAAPGDEPSKKTKKQKKTGEDGPPGGSSASPSLSSLSSPPLPPTSEKSRFSLTSTRRNSLGVVQESARAVVSKFALGPTSAEAVGFGGRGGRLASARSSSPALPPAGGGKPIAQ